MRRREFITGVAGAATVTCPLVAQAGRAYGIRRERSRRKGVALYLSAAACGVGLGRRPKRACRGPLGRRQCRPDAGRGERETLTIPIVFVNVSDPIGPGFVANLPRPGGNITGFIYAEASMGGKWVQLLTDIAPAIKRIAIIFNPDTAPGGGNYFLGSFEAAAGSLRLDAAILRVHSDAEIETGITSLSGDPRAGRISICCVSGATISRPHVSHG